MRKLVSRRGFSLVEVCLALGVVSFCLISMIGMLPTGLGALRDSKDETLHAQILQKISGDLQAADHASLASLLSGQSQTLYFDGDGQYLGKQGDAGAARQACYNVELSGCPPSLPGLSGATQASFGEFLQRIRVGITRTQAANSPGKWYALQISKN